jgi:hypothetical protein
VCTILISYTLNCDITLLPQDEDVSDRAWVGKEFFSLDTTAQKALLSTGNLLFCRTEPKDKQRLVKMLQEVLMQYIMYVKVHVCLLLLSIFSLFGSARETCPSAERAQGQAEAGQDAARGIYAVYDIRQSTCISILLLSIFRLLCSI